MAAAACKLLQQKCWTLGRLFKRGAVDEESDHSDGAGNLPAPATPQDLPPAVQVGERQAKGDPLLVERGILGAALDSLSGLRSRVVNVVAIAAFHENQTRAREAERTADEFRSKFHESDKSNAVLTERLTSARQYDKLRRILLSIGGPVAGAGVTLLLQSRFAEGSTLTLVGAVLMALGHGWLGPKS